MFYVGYTRPQMSPPLILPVHESKTHTHFARNEYL